MHRITEFVEIKAYVDVFNDMGHPGFKEPVSPFLWWSNKEPGKVADNVHIYLYDGLVAVLELDSPKNVKNLLLFALCKQKNILKKVLAICKNYDIINYNSDFRDKYRSITRRFDGSSHFERGKYYYTANGVNAWKLSGRH